MRQLASGVAADDNGAVNLHVLETGFFLIGQAAVGGQTILELRLAKTAGAGRRQLPESLRQDDLEAAYRLIELLRMLLRQP